MVQDQIWNLIAKKLSGESTEEELRDLEKLLRENPDLHYPVQAITDLWFYDLQFDQNQAHEAFLRHIQRMQDSNIEFRYQKDDEISRDRNLPSRKRKFLWPALTVSLIVGTFFLGTRFFASNDSASKYLSKGGKPAVRQILTKNNSRTRLLLSDGTKVWLNAGSSLTYDSFYDKNIREVVLIGEAFFDVFKNKNKPFIIHTSKINIKVLGTEFNVRSYATDKTTEASLIRGSIEVTFQDNPNKKIILKPNEKIVVDNDRKLESIPANTLSQSSKKISEVPGVAIKNLTYEYKTGAVIETSWIQNKLIFQDESFEQIAHLLERWYGVTIIFKNNKLKENNLTGNFRNETIRQALDALKLTASFNYEIDKDNIVIIY
jgi:transmembrane sensor